MGSSSNPPIDYSQKKRMLSIKTSDPSLMLEKLSGTEAVSQPFEFKLNMVSVLDSVDLKSLLRTPATVSLCLPDGSERYFNGIFRTVAQAREGEGEETERETMGVSNPARELTVYQGILVPKLWLLTLDSNCRIFQDKTVPDIIEKILKENGITDFQFRAPLRDTGRYPERDYCVQYRESSFNFISRLLEEEGIFYFFEHTESKHTIVFADNSSILSYCPKQNSAIYAYGQDGWVTNGEEGIINLERVEVAHTGKSVLTDYFFEKPSLNLKTSLPGDHEEVFDYPGKYSVMKDGERYTRVRLEEREASQFQVNGASRCRAFRPGTNFKLKGHYRKDTNQDYFLTSITHEVVDSTYRQDSDESHSYVNSFRAIPKSVPYRPPRLARKPFVQGPQPAVVVGKAGEEIWVDKYGRVKVQFFWDREGQKNENSSCWARVSQIWAGKGWGWITIPRIGQEVIVDFFEGDPDQPVITGRVYNAEQMPPYELPSNQTQSGIKTRSSKGGGTENYNEIRFEDKKGSEMITVHAEKDMETTVEHDDTQKIQHNRTINVDGTHTETIVGDTTITITEGNHSTTLNKGNQSTELKMGNQSTTLDMGNQSTELKLGNQSTQVDLGKIDMTAMQSITLTVGGSSIKVDQMGVTIQGMMIKITGNVMTEVQGEAILILKGGFTLIN
ncbi:MAG: type VI secretion system tip protein VgrG [Acidobacteria bacterium]|nr:type VI secretion system tip protein VgrG [Acidobacteriota bacterium]